MPALKADWGDVGRETRDIGDGKCSWVKRGIYFKTETESWTTVQSQFLNKRENAK